MSLSVLRTSTRFLPLKSTRLLLHTPSSLSARFQSSWSPTSIQAMPAATVARPNRASISNTNDSIPTFEVQLPPNVKVSKARKSGPMAKDLHIHIDSASASASASGSSSSSAEIENVPPPIIISTSAPAPAPAKKQRKSKKAVKVEEDVSNIDVEAEQPPVKRRRRAAQKAAIIEDDQADLDDSKSMTMQSVEPSEASDGEGEGEPELDSDGEPVKRNKKGNKIGKRAKKIKEPIVYVIPDVPSRDFRTEGPLELREERKDGFKGRLGYACLNTILRGQDPPKFCSRNVRIKTIDEKGLDWVKELALQNVKDIIPLLEFNAANNIHMMRLSSEIFPFAGHEKYGYDIAFASKELAEAGEVAKRLNQRLTMHPGQFCVLSTPRESVLTASIRELEVHAKVLDLMGIGPDGVMILHGGGTYGDREASLIRMKDVIENKLPPSVRRRLVLENDEMSYSAEELLPLCESVEPPVPFIFDFHHDLLRPSSLSVQEIIKRAQAIFAKRGITPKYHLSEPRPGAKTLMERRAHSDRCCQLPEALPYNADLMLECKDKEQGVLEMYRIYNLFDVNRDNLRPPADDLTTATGGRRSKLDGQGGATTKSRSPSPENSQSPKKESKRPVKESILVERAIEKAMAVAAKKGVEYKGPLSQKDREAARGPVMSAADVLEDMHKKAEWTRNELRQGRERPAYLEASDENKKVAAKEEPEPDAY
jgi:UV DNA damage endonuclease